MVPERYRGVIDKTKSGASDDGDGLAIRLYLMKVFEVRIQNRDIVALQVDPACGVICCLAVQIASINNDMLWNRPERRRAVSANLNKLIKMSASGFGEFDTQ
jgi:hypothetical protein